MVFLCYFDFLIQVDTHSYLMVELWDEDLQYDDLLLKCKIDPKKGSFTNTCWTSLGHLEVKVILTCDDYLTGDYCNEYRPIPQ